MPKRPANNAEILPGLKPVLEILADSPERASKVYCRHDGHMLTHISGICHKNGIPLEKVTLSFLDNICGIDANGRQTAHQGVAVQLTKASIHTPEKIFEAAQNAPLPMIIALDQVKDPGNLGALCRTAYALGCAGLLLPRHNSASLGPGAYKSSAGALEKMPCAIAPNLGHALDKAEEMDFHIYGASCEKTEFRDNNHSQNAFKIIWNFPSVLVLGNEEKGMRESIAKRCHTLVNIPLARNFNSLNVAQAGAIILGLCAAQINKS